MTTTLSRLICASLASAGAASATFALVFFVFLLCFPGDAGLSVGTAMMIGVLGLASGVIAFLGFLPGVMTIGVLAYAALDRLNRTGPIWAIGMGAVLAGIPGWFLMAGDASLTGGALGLAALVGGGIGGFTFRHVVREPIRRPPPVPPA